MKKFKRYFFLIALALSDQFASAFQSILKPTLNATFVKLKSIQYVAIEVCEILTSVLITASRRHDENIVKHNLTVAIVFYC
jgi:hypothetical protein